jgi:type IV pilus assembly protein PilM
MSILTRKENYDNIEENTATSAKISYKEMLRRFQHRSEKEKKSQTSGPPEVFFKPLPFSKKLSAKNVLAIDIGTDQIHYIVGKKNKNTIHIKKWGSEELNTEELDRFRSIEIALKYIKDIAFRRGMAVYVGFFSPDINIRQLVLPKLKPKELRNTIFFKNKTDLPNFSDDVIWDYSILETFTENNSEKVRVLVTVVPRDIIDMYLDVLKRARLKPDSLVPRPFALLSAYKKLIIEPGNHVLVDIGRNTTQICFFTERKLRAVRNFAVGSNNLLKAIQNEENSEKEKHSYLKFDAQSSPIGEPEGENKSPLNMRERLLKKVESIKSKHNPILHVLLNEIFRSLEFFRGSEDEYYISKVFVSGAGLQIESVMPFLKNGIHYPVKAISPQFSKKDTNYHEYSDFIGVVGLGLLLDKRLNMLPEEFRQKELFKNLNKITGIIIFFTLVYLSFITYLNKSESNQYTRSIKNIENQYNQLNPVEKIHKDLLEQISEIENQKQELLSFIIKDAQLIETLKLFSNELPPEIRLNSLEFSRYISPETPRKRANSNEDSQPSTTFKYLIGINGQITGEYFMGDIILINFINKLNDLGYFKKIDLLNKEKNPEQQKFIFQLELFL